jgi:septal ring factor EnvC (AmiA/AmiB activator)
MQRIILTLLLALGFGTLMAQKGLSREELERRRLRLMESIKETQAELATTRQDKKATMSQLHALQVQLESRQKLISSISTELGQIDGTIRNSQSEVNTLAGQVAFLQSRYAQSIRYAYRNRNAQSMMAYLFSASSFNDGIRRLAYLRKFREYRMAQADQIRSMQGNLQQKIGVLNNEKARKNVLRVAEETQKKVLQQEAAQTDKVVRELKGRESELAASVVKNQRAARNLDQAIASAIRREIEIARKKAEEEARRQAEIKRRQEEERQRIAAAKAAADREAAAKAAAATAAKSTGSKPATPAPNRSGSNGSKTYGNVALNTGSGTPATSAGTEPAPASTSTPVPAATAPAKAPRPTPAPVTLGLTPEAAALSASFESNRGRLPWPVDKGYIISGYGRQKHPVAENVTVENNGIDIQTTSGAAARAVFDGTVSKVFSVDGFGQTVLINHGQYFTIYSGLASASVSVGQQLHTKQTIGTVGPNYEGVPVLKFQVWKGAASQNPTGWIAR